MLTRVLYNILRGPVIIDPVAVKQTRFCAQSGQYFLRENSCRVSALLLAIISCHRFPLPP